MKTRYFILSAAGLIMGLAIIGCSIDREQNVDDAKENVKQANLEIIFNDVRNVKCNYQ